jgi:hypothetical protein
MENPITGPIIEDLKRSHEAPKEPPPTPTSVAPLSPPESAELDQDAGGGYNADHTIPQG